MRAALPLLLLRPLLGLLLLLPGCTGGDAELTPVTGPPLLWAATHPDGSRAWLFGTMHVSDPRVTRLAPAVETALEDCAGLWTELRATPEVYAAVVTAGSLPEGERLSGLLPAQTVEALRAEVLAHGGDFAVLDGMRPWLAEVSLGQLDAQPYMHGSGPALDVQLMQRAERAGKAVGEIETVAEQLAALTIGTTEEQVRRLQHSLETIAVARAEGRSPFAELFDAYVTGDADLLWRLAEEQLDTEEPTMLAWWDAVYTARNRRMAARLAAQSRARPGETQFYAFGVLHFLGPRGVVALLREEGWTVERVSAQPSSSSTASASRK